MNVRDKMVLLFIVENFPNKQFEIQDIFSPDLKIFKNTLYDSLSQLWVENYLSTDIEFHKGGNSVTKYKLNKTVPVNIDKEKLEKDFFLFKVSNFMDTNDEVKDENRIM